MSRLRDRGIKVEAPRFGERVVAVIAALEPGEVVSYGDVAAQAGSPGAARAVGNVLARSPGLPWWRVVAADGRLASGKKIEQARRLESEGVPVRDGYIAAKQ